MSNQSKPKTSTSLKEFDNSWYTPGKGRLTILLWYFTNVLFFLNPFFPFIGVKRWILRVFGAEIGSGVILKPRINIKYPWNITIGDYTWIGEGVWLDSLGKIEIGKNCCISQGAILICGNHNYKKGSFDLMVNDIILEDGVWLGAGSILAPGTHCKSHSLLTLGSVASGTLEEYKIYGGNPATFLKERKIN